jgi:hypothetical protein
VSCPIPAAYSQLRLVPDTDGFELFSRAFIRKYGAIELGGSAAVIEIFENL